MIVIGTNMKDIKDKFNETYDTILKIIAKLGGMKTILMVIGGIIGYFSIWIIIYLYRTFKKMEGMGLGDAKLMAGIGLLFGWQSIPLVLFLSAILGLFMVTPSLLEKKRNLKSKIPFGPYIIVAGLIYFLYGEVLYKTVLIVY